MCAITSWAGWALATVNVFVHVTFGQLFTPGFKEKINWLDRVDR
jgi:hypothetical protein